MFLCNKIFVSFDCLNAIYIIDIYFVFLLGFCFLFMIMNFVLRFVKVVFYIFGIVCFVEILVYIGYVISNVVKEDCVSDL